MLKYTNTIEDFEQFIAYSKSVANYKSPDTEFKEFWKVPLDDKRYEFLKTIENEKFDNLIFNSINIKSFAFDLCEFENIDFINVDFSRVNFDQSNFLKCRFYNCKFEDVGFNSSEFENCFFEYIEFNESSVIDSVIKNSKLLAVNWVFSIDSLLFIDSDITGNHFTGIGGYHYEGDFDPDMTFKNCNLVANIFEHCDIKMYFIKSKLSNNAFIDTHLLENSFQNTARDTEPANHLVYNHIDLQSLSKSDNLVAGDLETLFSIKSFNTQEYVREFFQEIRYETVFISFSFKNSSFAKSLRQQLFNKGVKTWFWPEDAPGGKRTKDIMYKGIEENERVVFICSEDSLKSQACHFELSEARKKEGRLWKEVLFPVRIDNSVFDEDFIKKILKYEREFADEWIANIEWLREYNILDFSKFYQENIDIDSFTKAIFSLANDLRKPTKKE